MCYLRRRIKGHNIIISIFSLVLITSSFGIMTLHFAYGQASQVNSNKNGANLLNVRNIPAKKSMPKVLLNPLNVLESNEL
jgi:predicted RND superfamily exporter protein